MDGSSYRRRSTASLLASGVATLNFDQPTARTTAKSTRQALRDDQAAITRDFRRSTIRIAGEFEPA